jgi:hypothetical protein
MKWTEIPEIALLMRVSITLIVIFSSVATATAQSDINFSNYGGGVDAPITNSAGNPISGSSLYVADLFLSTNLNASFDSLVAAGYNQRFLRSGYFLGGSKTLLDFTYLVQVRAWDTNYGSTYYRARDAGGEFGFSNFITITPSVGPGTPAPLLGLQGFQLQRLPSLSNLLTPTNAFVLSWQVQQTAYVVQQNPDLSMTNWITLSNTPVTIGQEQQVVLPVPPTGRMFYRLISQWMFSPA